MNNAKRFKVKGPVSTPRKERGVLTLTLPKTKHQRLILLARQANVSVPAVIRQMIQHCLDEMDGIIEKETETK